MGEGEQEGEREGQRDRAIERERENKKKEPSMEENKVHEHVTLNPQRGRDSRSSL